MPRGALPSFLDYIDLPGQATRNLLKGNTTAARNKALDFLLGPAHLLSGGDALIPYASDETENVSGGELFGMNEPGMGKLAADIGVGALTDPLTYLSFGTNQGLKFLGKTVAGAGKTLDPLTVSMEAAKGVANKGANLIDRFAGNPSSSTIRTTPAKDFLDNMGIKWRSATGSESLDPWLRENLALSGATGKIASETGSREVSRIMDGLDPLHQEALGDYAQQIYKDKQGVHSLLPDDEIQRMAEIQRLYPTVDPTLFQSKLRDMEQLGKTQSFDAMGMGPLPAGTVIHDKYIPRSVSMPPEFRSRGTPTSTQANFERERSLITPQERVDFFNKPENADVQYERNAAKLMMDRATGQGRMLEKNQLKSAVLKNLPAPTLKPGATPTSSVDQMIADRISEYSKVSPDGAKRLDSALNGMDKRNGFFQTLASTNRYMKPAMVAGILIPKIASHVRNRMAQPFQIMAREGFDWKDVGASYKNLIPDLLHSMDEAIAPLMTGGKKTWILPKDDLASNLHAVDQAFRDAKGSVGEVRRLLNARNPALADAVDHGVLDGYVSSEELLKKINVKGWKKYALDAIDMPSEMMQVAEQRSRLAYFLQQRARNTPAAKAAEDTKETFFNYNVNSQGNRNLRDSIPFAQFMLKAIPSQAKWLSRNPGIAAGLQPLYAEDKAHPLPQYSSDQLRIFLGSEGGKDNYFTGLGLPMESLNVIPFSGSDVSKKIVGSTHPFIKTAVANTFGIDPYFMTPFGSYDKNPFTGENSEFGRVYNMVSGAGITAPLDSVVRQFNTATSDKGIGTNLVDLLSSGRSTSVDPDKAHQQMLDAELRARPDVKRSTTYYQTKGQEDPEVTALLNGLMDARKRVKLKAQAAAML